MCLVIGVRHPDQTIAYADTREELESLLQGPVPGLEGEEPDHCLCAMDPQITAAKYGLELHRRPVGAVCDLLLAYPTTRSVSHGS